MTQRQAKWPPPRKRRRPFLMPKRWGVERSDGNAQGRDARSVLEYGTTAAKGRLCICSRATWTDDAQAVSFGFHMHEGFCYVPPFFLHRTRLVAVNFFITACISVRRILSASLGCGHLRSRGGPAAFETSALVFGLNLVLIFATFCSGAHLWTSLGPAVMCLLAVCVLLCASGVFGLVCSRGPYSALALLAILYRAVVWRGGLTAHGTAYPRFLTEVPDEPFCALTALNNIATSVAVIVGDLRLEGVYRFGLFPTKGCFFLLAVAPVSRSAACRPRCVKALLFRASLSRSLALRRRACDRFGKALLPTAS